MARTFIAAVILLGLSLSRLAFADGPAAIPPVPRAQVKQTVNRAIGYLQTESAAWLKQRKCAACHHVAMPIWALGEAGRQGYAIDRTFLTDTGEATLGSLRKMMAVGIAPDPAAPPDPRPLAKGVSTGAVFMAVEAQSLPSLDDGQKQSLRLIAADVIKKQRDDGSWDFFLSRPPINESQATDTAWILMALQGETAREKAMPASVTRDVKTVDSTQPGSTPRPAATPSRIALEKGTAWLDRADLSAEREARVLRLLVALRAGAPRSQVQPAINDLLSLQHPDGGWSQLANTPSDAFATGQALYVLALAGHTADSPALKRAIAFLVSTQSPDGSWPMTSRATPDGRPGSAKLLTPIQCAAASWATMGLARVVPGK
jgi:hypothetical protein